MPFTVLVYAYGILLLLDAVLINVIADVKDIAILTPLFFAGIVFLNGIMLFKPDLKQFGRHGTMGLALLAFISSVGSVLDLFEPGTSLSYPALSKSIMAVLSILFLILAIGYSKSDSYKNERHINA